jgi:hypothetical protein
MDQMALRACFIVEPLMIELDLGSGDPEPEQAKDGLHGDDGCGDGRNGWWVAQPA